MRPKIVAVRKRNEINKDVLVCSNTTVTMCNNDFIVETKTEKGVKLVCYTIILFVVVIILSFFFIATFFLLFVAIRNMSLFALSTGVMFLMCSLIGLLLFFAVQGNIFPFIVQVDTVGHIYVLKNGIVRRRVLLDEDMFVSIKSYNDSDNEWGFMVFLQREGRKWWCRTIMHPCTCGHKSKALMEARKVKQFIEKNTSFSVKLLGWEEPKKSWRKKFLKKTSSPLNIANGKICKCNYATVVANSKNLDIKWGTIPVDKIVYLLFLLFLGKLFFSSISHFFIQCLTINNINARLLAFSLVSFWLMFYVVKIFPTFMRLYTVRLDVGNCIYIRKSSIFGIIIKRVVFDASWFISIEPICKRKYFGFVVLLKNENMSYCLIPHSNCNLKSQAFVKAERIKRFIEKETGLSVSLLKWNEPEQHLSSSSYNKESLYKKDGKISGPHYQIHKE